MSKVYDCFAFFNELDLLELRLEELDSVVDHFVLVEATKTFQKDDKPLYYELNKQRFAKFHHKIIHVVVDQFPTFFTRFRVPRPWDFDNSQKEYILKGLKGAQPDDVIIISDLDEIPLAEKVRAYKDTPGIKVFEQYLSYYYLNNVCTFLNGERQDTHAVKNKQGIGWWRGSVMLPYKMIKTIKATRLYRDLPEGKVTVVYEGGWHFSYIGGVDVIMHKIKSWAHKEYNNDTYNNRESILKAIYEGRSLFDENTKFKVMDINSSLPFPKIIKTNPHFAPLLLPFKN